MPYDKSEPPRDRVLVMRCTMAIFNIHVGVILEPAARKYRDYVFDKGDSSGYC